MDKPGLGALTPRLPHEVALRVFCAEVVRLYVAYANGQGRAVEEHLDGFLSPKSETSFLRIFAIVQTRFRDPDVRAQNKACEERWRQLRAIRIIDEEPSRMPLRRMIDVLQQERLLIEFALSAKPTQVDASATLDLREAASRQQALVSEAVGLTTRARAAVQQAEALTGRRAIAA